MATPTTIDERIAALVPEIDDRLRDGLTRALTMLRGEPNPDEVPVIMERLSLMLLEALYATVGETRPKSGNLGECITRASVGNEDKNPKTKIVGLQILPRNHAASLNNIREFSNPIKHDSKKISPPTRTQAEAAIHNFLGVMEWFYCTCEDNPNRLPSIFADKVSEPTNEGHLRAVEVFEKHASEVTRAITKNLKKYLPDSEKFKSDQELINAFFDGNESVRQLPLTFLKPKVIQVNEKGQTLGEVKWLSDVVFSGNDRHVILMGPGGAGKSTALSEIFLQCTRTPKPSFPSRVIYSRLNRLNGEGWIGNPSRFVSETASGIAELDVPFLLKSSEGVLLILDGLNELRTSVRNQALALIDSIEALAKNLESVTDRIVIGCREQEFFQPEGILQKLLRAESDFAAYQLCPPDQDKVQRVFHSIGATELYPRLDNSVLTNPLLIALTCKYAPRIECSTDLENTIESHIIFESILEEITERDVHDRFLADGLRLEGARFGLEMMAVLMLQLGGTASSREDIEDGIRAAQHTGAWASSEWWKETSFVKRTPKQIVTLLTQLHLMEVTGKEIRFTHERWRDFLASSRMIECMKARNGQWNFELVSQPRWDEALAFVIKRTRDTRFLVAAMRKISLSDYARRRAAELWGRFGQLKDIDQILDTFTENDPLLLDFAGHAILSLIDRCGQDAIIDISRRIKRMTSEQASFNAKIKATRIARSMGMMIGPEAVDAMVRLINDDPSPEVRVGAIYSIASSCAPPHFIEAVSKQTKHQKIYVCSAAFDVFSNHIRFRRSASVLTNYENCVNDFYSQRSAASERYLLIRRAGLALLCQGHLLEILEDEGDRTDNDHQTLRWRAALTLCRAGNRRHLRPVERDRVHVVLQNCADDACVAPLKSALTELEDLIEVFDNKKTSPADFQLYGHEPVGITFQASLENHQAKNYWEQWQALRRKLEKGFRYPCGSPNASWECVRFAYDFFALAEESQAEIISHLAFLLNDTEKAPDPQESRHAVMFLANIGVPNSDFLSLRIRALTHSKDPNIRFYAATCPFGGGSYQILASTLYQRFSDEEVEPDRLVRREVGQVLLSLAGDVCLSDIIDRMHKDSSPLFRGFFAEHLVDFASSEDVQKGILHLLDDKNDYVRARALRCLSRIGVPEHRQRLLDLCTDTTMTRLGCIGDLAKAAVASIEEYWTDK